MNEKAKSLVKDLLGKRVAIKVNLGRNKEEIYEGIITNLYKNIFLLKTKHYNKSFSYIDLITKDIIVKKL